MNTSLNDFTINLFNKQNMINEWLSHKYKEKPIAIYGNPGIGKTTIAKYILKDWTQIHIDCNFCKRNIHLETFLNDSLYKKSITMMFNNKVYKSLIIDDLYYIQNNDKKLFKSIIQFSKKKNINHHPIIYIFNIVSHKTIKTLLLKCFPFKIEFTLNHLIDITEQYLLNKGKSPIHRNQIKDLVIQSNMNLNNIITNIEFYKDNFKHINKYENTNNELSEHIRSIIHLKDTTSIYNNSYSDYNIIGLNILENINIWLQSTKSIKEKKKLFILDQIYWLNTISDSFLNTIHETSNWNIIDNIITFNIVIPIQLININHINVTTINYNKYISKCIIYIHNNNLFNNHSLNIDILTFLYTIIQSYIHKGSDKLKNMIINYINYYNISQPIIEKFMKYFLKENYKLKIKQFF
tara:strand:- start:2387 stop:3610 length:1224 start_codon:yes stop_codon:yes gene_type:complete